MALTHNQAAVPRLIRAKRVEAEYGVPHSSLRDAVHRGEIPVVRLATHWYFERRDLDQWIESRKQTA